MTRKWMKGLIVIVLACPAALVPAAVKQSSERSALNHVSETEGALPVKLTTTGRFGSARNGKSMLIRPRLLKGLELVPGDYEEFVNWTPRKATIEVDAGKMAPMNPWSWDSSPNRSTYVPGLSE